MIRQHQHDPADIRLHQPNKIFAGALRPHIDWRKMSALSQLTRRIQIALYRDNIALAKQLCDEATHQEPETPVEELAVAELSMGDQIINALEDANIIWVSEILEMDNDDLHSVPNVGEYAIKMIDCALKEFGLSREKDNNAA